MSVPAPELWLTVAFAGTGTYLIRLSFFALARRVAQPPPALVRVLRMIPPAALSALALPPILRPEGEAGFDEPTLWAGLVAAVVAWRTNNVALTLVVGMAVLLGLDATVT